MKKIEKDGCIGWINEAYFKKKNEEIERDIEAACERILKKFKEKDNESKN